MDTEQAIDIKFDLALKQLQESPENGKSVTVTLYGIEYTLRIVGSNPFVLEITTSTGEGRTYEKESD